MNEIDRRHDHWVVPHVASRVLVLLCSTASVAHGAVLPLETAPGIATSSEAEQTEPARSEGNVDSRGNEIIIVSMASRTSIDDPVALGAADLVAALRLRLGAAPVDVMIDDGVHQGWRVDVLSTERGGLQIRISNRNGRLVTQRILSTERRRPRDIAHTVALLVVESLAPLIPEILAPPVLTPPPEHNSASAQEPEQPTVQVAPPREEAWRFGLGVEARGLHNWPTQQSALGAGVVASARYDHGLLELGVAWSTPNTYRGVSYRVAATPIDFKLLGGAAWPQGWLWLGAAAGANARVILAKASGAEPEFRSRSDLAWGWAAEVVCGATTPYLDLAMVLEVSQVTTHPRFVVDGERVVNTGHTALGLALRVGYGG